MLYVLNVQVVPGRAGGGSFRRKNNYIAKKEFAYRMCARRPTSAMPKTFLCCERAFCCSMVVMWPVLMHVMSFDVVVMSFDAMWLLVLCHVTWCNAMSCDVPCNGHVVCSKWFCDNVVIQSTILYYKVLLQYYSVLQSTTLYYRVLLQYYSVLHSTTTYYSSTTLYYKVLLQYYSVLQSTTPVLLCTTKYYSSTTLYYTILQRTTPVLLCTKVLLQYYSVLQSSIHDWSLTHMTWLMSVAYETSFTMRGVTGVILQLHQILHLPRKMTVMIDPRHIWNGIYNARSNRSHNPTSPNTAPATQNESHDWSASHMKRHLQCAEQQESQSNSPNTAPATQKESHDWSASHMKRHLECAEQAKSTSNLTKYCACHAKWISWLIRVSYETSFPMRGESTVSHQPQQIARLPRKMNPMINPRHTWNVIYNARSMHSQPPTSPNTAPATKSASSRLQRKLRELLPPIERRFDDNPTIIRAWSEHEIVISHPPLRRPYSSDLEHDFVLKNTTFRAPAISQNVTKCCACHEKSHSNFTKYCACRAKWIPSLIRVTHETSFTMRGACTVSHQPHQILRLPRNLQVQDFSGNSVNCFRH